MLGFSQGAFRLRTNPRKIHLENDIFIPKRCNGRGLLHSWSSRGLDVRLNILILYSTVNNILLHTVRYLLVHDIKLFIRPQRTLRHTAIIGSLSRITTFRTQFLEDLDIGLVCCLSGLVRNRQCSIRKTIATPARAKWSSSWAAFIWN